MAEPSDLTDSPLSEVPLLLPEFAVHRARALGMDLFAVSRALGFNGYDTLEPEDGELDEAEVAFPTAEACSPSGRRSPDLAAAASELYGFDWPAGVGPDPAPTPFADQQADATAAALDHGRLKAHAIGRHSSVVDILRWFDYGHLPQRSPARSVSSEFTRLVGYLLTDIPTDSPELAVALRKLLEAKDAAVRAAIEDTENRVPPTE